MRRDVRLIAAVGRQGQLGLNGGLPWGDRFPEDRMNFRSLTRDCVVLVGWRTWFTVQHLDKTAGRRFYTPGSRHYDPKDVLRRLDERMPEMAGAPVWIAGGAETYRRWLSIVNQCHVTVLDYDGPADTWMPPLWGPRDVTASDWRGSSA